jgi:hypothetical protein
VPCFSEANIFILSSSKRHVGRKPSKRICLKSQRVAARIMIANEHLCSAHARVREKLKEKFVACSLGAAIVQPFSGLPANFTSGLERKTLNFLRWSSFVSNADRDLADAVGQTESRSEADGRQKQCPALTPG